MKGFGIKRTKFGAVEQCLQIPDVSGIHWSIRSSAPFGPSLRAHLLIPSSSPCICQSHLRSPPHAMLIAASLASAAGHPALPPHRLPFPLLYRVTSAASTAAAQAPHRSHSCQPRRYQCKEEGGEERKEKKREKDWIMFYTKNQGLLDWIWNRFQLPHL